MTGSRLEGLETVNEINSDISQRRTHPVRRGAGSAGFETRPSDGEHSGVVILDSSLHVLTGKLGGSVASHVAALDTGTSLKDRTDRLYGRIARASEEALQSGAPNRFEVTLDDRRSITGAALPMGNSVAVRLKEADSDSARASTTDSEYSSVCLLDATDRITAIDDELVELSGQTRDQLVGAPKTQLFVIDAGAAADEIGVRTDGGVHVPIQVEEVALSHGKLLLIEPKCSLLDRWKLERALLRAAEAFVDAEHSETVLSKIPPVIEEVCSHARTVVYSFDASTTTLEPVAGDIEDALPRNPGCETWMAFVAAQAENSETGGRRELGTPGAALVTPQRSEIGWSISSGRSDPREEVPPPEIIFASLADRGLARITIDRNAPSQLDLAFVERLLTYAVSALERIEMTGKLDRQRDRLAVRREEITRSRKRSAVLNQVAGKLDDARTVSEATEAACTQIAELAEVAFAWMGDADKNTDLVHRIAQSGEDRGYLDWIAATQADESIATVEPTARAIKHRELVCECELSDAGEREPWRQQCLMKGFQAVVSVPVAHQRVQYGALTIYATESDAIGEEFVQMLETIATTVGNTINRVIMEQSLHEEADIELSFSLSDPEALLCRLAARLGDPVTISSTIPRDRKSAELYIQTAAGEPADIEALPTIKEVREPSDSNCDLVVTVSEPPITGCLANFGARVKEMRAECDRIDSIVNVPSATNVRRLMNRLGEHYRNVELNARRRQNRGSRSSRAPVIDDLTERQREVAREAYRLGYFEWPREKTGEEVANALDITQPTFNRHLRITEQAIFAELFSD